MTLKLIHEKKDEKEIEIDGKVLKITHLDKVFWPKEGYTKGDLINFYIKIAPYILPYLKNRPQSLNRFPNGIKGKSFYQKNMNGLPPKWIKIIPVLSEEKSEKINYMVCNDLASLIFMINLGCIDINPWNSKDPTLDKPDYLLLDLDPEDIDFSYVLKTASVIKKICDKLSVSCYPKTSGATGVHIYIPLGAKYSYEQCRTFAQILANLAHQTAPDFTSVERSPSKRQKKVYIDYLQNAKGQTLAAPFCVRPKEKAPVSTPLLWEEIKKGEIKPTDFTFKNIFYRLEKIGDIFQPVLGKGIDIEKALKMIENRIK